MLFCLADIIFVIEANINDYTILNQRFSMLNEKQENYPD